MRDYFHQNTASLLHVIIIIIIIIILVLSL
jgi:hypothetical protein